MCILAELVKGPGTALTLNYPFHKKCIYIIQFQGITVISHNTLTLWLHYKLEQHTYKSSRKRLPVSHCWNSSCFQATFHLYSCSLFFEKHLVKTLLIKSMLSRHFTLVNNRTNLLFFFPHFPSINYFFLRKTGSFFGKCFQ